MNDLRVQLETFDLVYQKPFVFLSARCGKGNNGLVVKERRRLQADIDDILA